MLPNRRRSTGPGEAVPVLDQTKVTRIEKRLSAPPGEPLSTGTQWANWSISERSFERVVAPAEVDSVAGVRVDVLEKNDERHSEPAGEEQRADGGWWLLTGAAGRLPC